MKKTLLTAATAAAAVALAPAAAFAAPPQQRLDVKLTSTKAGTKKKPTAVGITVSTGTTTKPDEANKRHTIVTAKISLPKGIALNYKAFPACNLPEGDAGKVGGYCEQNAPKSKVGSGTAKASVVDVDFEPTGVLTPYIGTNGRLLIRTQFEQPAVIDQPLIGNVTTSGGAYAFGFSVPTELQTPIPNADQQILDFTLKFDKKTAKKGKKKIGLVELTSCPKGGYVFKGDFTYKSGETTSVTTTVPCKQGK